jgi:SMP-30/Gluconolactonase/LRE-like region
MNQGPTSQRWQPGTHRRLRLRTGGEPALAPNREAARLDSHSRRAAVPLRSGLRAPRAVLSGQADWRLHHPGRWVVAALHRPGYGRSLAARWVSRIGRGDSRGTGVELQRRHCRPLRTGLLPNPVVRAGQRKAVSAELRRFPAGDGSAGEISLFDYDVEHGSLHNRRLFARFAEADGMPDEATVDQDGQVWSAFWGWRLHRPPALRWQRGAQNSASHSPGFQLNLWRRRLPQHLRYYRRRTSQEPQRSVGRRVVSDSQRSSRGAGILLSRWDFIDLRTE